MIAGQRRQLIALTIVLALLTWSSVQPASQSGMVTGTGLDITTPYGFLRMTGNESTTASVVDDPPKYRLASRFYTLGALSANWLRPDGVQEETAMLLFKTDASLRGLLEVWLRKPNTDGDGALVMVGSVSVDQAGSPVTTGVFARQSTIEDPPPPPPPPPLPPAGITVPQALLYTQNLGGTVGDVQVIGDERWLTALDRCCDTWVDVELNLPANGTLRVEVRRAGGGETAPYLYIRVDDVQVYSGQLESVMPTIVERAITAGVRHVRVRSSAQNGTIEVGGLLVQH